MGTGTYSCFCSSQLRIFWGGQPGGGGVGGVVGRPRGGGFVAVHDVAGREAQIARVAVDVRDEVVLPGVEPAGRPGAG